MKLKEWDKLTNKYFEEILSPFAKGVDSPIYRTIKSIKNKNKVIDIGTGLGVLVPFLSKNFKQVVAIDFSEKMIKNAKKKNKQNNVTFLVKDMTKLKEFYNTFNVAVSINSIIMPSLVDVKKTFQEVYNILKPNGILIGVFPAIESESYEALLTFEREFKKTKDEEKAINNTHRLIGDNYDYLTGVINYKGKQKHYYKFELDYRLKQIGFNNIKISKVLYPWKVYGGGIFRNKPGIWDWFVIAKK